MSLSAFRVAPTLVLGGCVLIVGPPIGDPDDTGDTGDTGNCVAGTVTFTPDGGTAEDLTALFAVGTASSPAAHTIAAPGTLAFCGGTYFPALTVTSDEATITGQGADATVLSGGATGRIVHHQGAESVTLTGLRLTLGRAADGAAVLADVGDIDVSECAFVENDATNRGGALAALQGEIAVVDSTFDDNSASEFGGAVWVGGELTLTDVVLDGNEADGGVGVGGAVFSQGSLTTITRSTFRDNESRNVGGGFYGLGGTVVVVASTFSGNRSLEVSGGGLAMVDGTATLTDTVFDDNTAFDEGGAASFSNTNVTCVRTEGASGGFYANQPGVLFADLGDDTFTSDRCDWGEGAQDNVVYDIGTIGTGGTLTPHTFGDDASFTCDDTTCTPAR